MRLLAGAKERGANGVVACQRETMMGVGKELLGRLVVACRISQIEGTEKSTSLLLSELVCRA